MAVVNGAENEYLPTEQEPDASGYDLRLRFVHIPFRSRLSARNEFARLHCERLMVCEPEGYCEEEDYGLVVAALMDHVNSRTASKLNGMLRDESSSWPSSAAMRAHVAEAVTSLMLLEVTTAVVDFLTTSPVGVGLATSFFCNASTLTRIIPFLQMLADKNGFPLSHYVQEDVLPPPDDDDDNDTNEEEMSNVYLFLEKLTKDELAWLKNEYTQVNGEFWIRTPWVAHRKTETVITPPPYMAKVYRYKIGLETEGLEVDASPSVFLIDLTQKLQPVADRMLSLRAAAVKVIVNQLVDKHAESMEDQEPHVTVENLKLPANVVDDVILNYRAMKSKMRVGGVCASNLKRSGSYYFFGLRTVKHYASLESSVY